MGRLSLSLLGSVMALLDGQTLTFRSNRGKALLIYLLTERVFGTEIHQRESLMGLLWPGLPQKSAQVNLRQTLYQLRQAISPVEVPEKHEIVSLLQTDRQTIALDSHYPITSDIEQFTTLLDGPQKQWPEAVDLYRDDFLVDFFLPDSNTFEEWAAARRATFRRRTLETLDYLAQEALDREDGQEAERFARRQLSIDNLRESAHCQLMQALSLVGQRSQALVQYDEVKRLLHIELGAEPSVETQTLYQQLLSGRPLTYSNLSTEPAITQTSSSLQNYHNQTIASLSNSHYQLDNRFVKLTLMLDQGPDASGMRFVRDEKTHQYDNLKELLADIEEQAVVILGQPGSGKTTLLRRLQFDLAQAELQHSTGQVAFFAALNGYRPTQIGQPPPEPVDWLADEWVRRYPNLPDFLSFWQQGQIYLLLDGLNEIPHRDKADYRERIGRWRYFLQATRRYGNRVVFSCRNLDYSAPLSSTAVPVRQVQVEPLTSAQIETFLHAYLPQQGERVWLQLQQDKQYSSLFSVPFFLRLLVAQVDNQGKLPTGHASILTGFVRSSLRREVTEQTHHFFQPGVLLSEGDYEQVLHNAWQTPYELPWEGELFSQLEYLAFTMQDGSYSSEIGQVRLLEREALQLLDHPHARDIVQAGLQLNILDKEVATHELFFSHQIIQEYFAARLLAQNPDPTKVVSPWREEEIEPSLAETLAGLERSEPLPTAPTTGWEVTTLLAAAMTANQEQFVRDLIPVNLPLAARCAAVSEVRLSESLVNEIQQALIRRIETPQTDLRARIAAAHSLGELGDPRFESCIGPYGPYLRPPLAHIPGGTYPIGSDDDSDIEDDIGLQMAEIEKPAHFVNVAAFAMGIFLVTNAEFRLFWEGGGYEDERWWPTEAARIWRREGAYKINRESEREERAWWQSQTEALIKSIPATSEAARENMWKHNASDEEFEAWLIERHPAGELYRQPNTWNDSLFNRPAQPVFGISWFEALAYCTWLSAQTGEIYDLPTEVEWEAAARGLEGRRYAFGNTYDPTCCNVFETHIRHTTPVALFPAGRTPEGIFDMTGNVFEWTTTLWGKTIQVPDYPYPYEAEDGRENREEPGLARRIHRGGAFYSWRSRARATSRGKCRPHLRLTLGFRVVRRQPISQ